MLFTEARFFLWLALSLIVFWAAAPRFRAAVLLLISLAFWLISSPQGTVWLGAVMLITWLGGRRIAASPVDSAERARWLKGTIGLLVLILAGVKFAPGVFPVLTPWVAGQGSLGGLPMGISYFTFHCLGYLLDVHWSNEKPMPAGSLLLYLTFFPKAVMGPIERSGAFQSQTESLSSVRWAAVETAPACFQISLGLFMKFVLADRIKLFVDGYYQVPPGESGVPGLLAAVMFCWQLYYDFFSYSLIAVGVGRLFGYRLSNNFNRPFFATSISDFWSRWHMSLSGWFQTYFYTPLRFQLRRRRQLALIVAGMTTFLAIGIWHGTGWTFVVLGLVNGLLVTAEALYPRLRQVPSSGWARVFKAAFTFFIVATMLVLFRAPTLSSAGSVYAHFFDWRSGSVLAIVHLLSKFDWMLVVVLAGVVEVLTWRGVIEGGGDACARIARLGPWRRAFLLGMALSAAWALGMFGKTSFLYNQF